jgi:hypothetical protein
MKVIIAGSRHMTDASLIPFAVEKSGFEVTQVVCGMQRGADMLGKAWAHSVGISVAEFPPDWDRYGRAAGPIRNGKMARYADALIVFIYPGSVGSVNMLVQMSVLKKPCYPVMNGIVV